MSDAKPTMSQERRAQAVAIAQDVLSRLEQRKLYLRSGTYLNILSGSRFNVRERFSTDPLSTVVDQIEPYCEVCALGLAFCPRPGSLVLMEMLGNTSATRLVVTPPEVITDPSIGS